SGRLGDASRIHVGRSLPDLRDLPHLRLAVRPRMTPSKVGVRVGTLTPDSDPGRGFQAECRQHSADAASSARPRGSFIAIREPSVFVTYPSARSSSGMKRTICPPAPPQPMLVVPVSSTKRPKPPCVNVTGVSIILSTAYSLAGSIAA